MKIYITDDIPDSVTDTIAKFFPNVVRQSKNLHVFSGNSTLKNVLIGSGLMADEECISIDNFKFTSSIEKIKTKENVMAVILSINIIDSIDIDFIFKQNDVEIIFKDSLYWKSFYFYYKRQLHDEGINYDGVDPDIISYMLHGKYINEMDYSCHGSLMDLYKKGERNFKNLMVLDDMIKI
jgi:hypothetical protein